MANAMMPLSEFLAVRAACEKFRTALENIALLDEADGHELTAQHALEACAIATSALGKHPSEIFAARAPRDHSSIPPATESKP
jgi:hypothetical protein